MEKAWFFRDNSDIRFSNVGANKAIYRILPFDALLQMFCEKANTLVKTTMWEDVYENFLLKETIIIEDHSLPLDRFFSNWFYGQCWSLKRSSDALWRLYSYDKKSVQIKTTIGKLFGVCEESKDKDSVFLMGKVDYYSQAKIDRDLQTLPKLSLEEFSNILLQSFFVKRDSFKHEEECRVIVMKKTDFRTETAPVIKLNINPLDFIESVCFDPRADDAYVERCSRILHDVFAYPFKKMKRSSLYAFNPVELTIFKDA